MRTAKEINRSLSLGLIYRKNLDSSLYDTLYVHEVEINFILKNSSWRGNLFEGSGNCEFPSVSKSSLIGDIASIMGVSQQLSQVFDSVFFFHGVPGNTVNSLDLRKY